MQETAGICIRSCEPSAQSRTTRPLWFKRLL